MSVIDARERTSEVIALRIRRASPDDAATLTRIAWEAKRSWGYPEEWMSRWRKVLTIEPAVVAYLDVHCAMEADQVVGFYAFCIESGALRLEHLWVLASAMGRGVGRALFEHAVSQTNVIGFASFTIESDPNALGFYERMGAYTVGLTRSDIGALTRELPVLRYSLGAVTSTEIHNSQMKNTGKCPKCGSTQIIADAKAVDRGHSNSQHEMSIATFRKPEALIFKEKQQTDVSAWVCADCGYVEFYADKPRSIVKPKGAGGDTVSSGSEQR